MLILLNVMFIVENDTNALKCDDNDIDHLILPNSQQNALNDGNNRNWYEINFAKIFRCEDSPKFWCPFLITPPNSILYRDYSGYTGFSYTFRSGNAEHVSDKFYDTTVEVRPVRRNYTMVGSFDEFGIAEGDLKMGPISAIRLKVNKNSRFWVILSEVRYIQFIFLCNKMSPMNTRNTWGVTNAVPAF